MVKKQVKQSAISQLPKGKRAKQSLEQGQSSILEFKMKFPAAVSYSESYTFTQNFQSVKIQVGITVPAEDGNIEEAYQKATQFVRQKLNERSEEIANFLKSDSSEF